ncbi:MAG: D-alanyl-D-alanine carboxypeptidase [Bacilli bacterium]|nr:D-alanyl-D-alanine carboxypeptidase [Bacilli bacterium]
MKKIFLLTFIFFIGIINLNAEVNLTPNSKSSILIEQSTGKILYEKNSKEKMAPASMTKIMTMLLIMEALEDEKIALDDEVFISEHAAGMGGSQLFLPQNGYMKVDDLLKGIAIGSANDAATAMAEYIGGTEENFVEMMNKKVKELGLNNTNFKNPHGLDEEDHYTTAYDLAVIAKELLKYEDIIKYTSTYEEYLTINGEKRWLVNTNSLVRFYEGMDGLKTGFTENAMYCLTSTMKKNNMRLIGVVMGVETKDNRSKDTISLMEYGYSMFGTKTMIENSEILGKIHIDKSKDREYNFYLEKDVKLVVDKGTKDIEYTYDIKLDNVKAPLKKGDKVGILRFKYNSEELEYNLVVNENIKKSSYFRVMFNYLKDVFSGNFNFIR